MASDKARQQTNCCSCSSDTAPKAFQGLWLALRPPLASLWDAPGCAPDVAAWRPLLATLEHLQSCQTGSSQPAALPASVPSQLQDSGIDLGEAAALLRLDLAAGAAARSDKQLTVRLLNNEPAVSSAFADSGASAAAASPLQLLCELRAATLLAQLPAETDLPLGSGRAPALSARLCTLLDSMVGPLSSCDAEIAGAAVSLGPPAGGAGGQPQAGAGGVVLQQQIVAMPTAVKRAAASGCLLLARWAQVRAFDISVFCS